MSIEASEGLAAQRAGAATVPGYASGSSAMVEEPQVHPPRNFLRQALRDTFSQTTARWGLAWLVVITIFAVFGPFIANSHPFLMKSGGRWSSPLLLHLTPADVLLLLAVVVAASLAIGRRASPGLSILIVAGSVLVMLGPALLLVRPPENVVYERYREGVDSGKIQTAWHTVIPFSPSDRLRDQTDARLRPPNRQHWLGTDTNGSDLLSGLIHASRIALSIGFMATGISVVIGIIVGGIMGYYVGLLDLIGMRIIEIFEAVPRLLLLISITAFIEKRNIYLMMTVLGVTGWTGYARYLRGEFLSLRQRDFVQAAVAAGLPTRLILFRHMLLNGLTPILINTTFGVAGAILTESVLTFLGLGLVDEPSWGGFLNQARAGGSGFIWWLAVFPGMAIFLTVFAYNLVGESIRDALDPKLLKRD